MTCVQPNLAYLVSYTGNETIAKILGTIIQSEPFLAITLPKNTIEINDYSNYLYDVVNKLNWRSLIFLSIDFGRPIMFQDYFEQTYQKLMETEKFHLKKIKINARNATFENDLIPHLGSWVKGQSAILLFGHLQSIIVSNLNQFIGESKNKTFLIAHEQKHQRYRNDFPTPSRKCSWLTLRMPRHQPSPT